MANYLIIGATSTIGKELCNKLAENGHELFITSTNEEKISQLNLDVEKYILDASDFEATDKCFQNAISKFGKIDGIVCFAGSLWLKNAANTSEQEFDNVINRNLKTGFSVVRAAQKNMKDGGSVVLISSGAALQGFSNHEAIAAAKAGLVGLARAASASSASHNLRFNVVAPGLVETNLTTMLTSNEMNRKVSESMHALGRLGKPKDIANAVMFLLDKDNDWIDGNVLNIDGGLANIAPKTKI